MRKFKLFFDKEKEEKWLNEMCRQGWGMTNFFMGVYTFMPCAPGQYTYQVDLPEFQGGTGRRDQRKRDYIEFVESTGAEYVCSWVFYMIFRKETCKGNFKLYTDPESEIRLFGRLRRLFLLVGLIEFFLSIFQTANYINYVTNYWGPNLGENVVMFLGLCLPYAFTITIIIMVIRFTRKINKLKLYQ